MKPFFHEILLILLPVLAFAPVRARACAACMGGADTPVAPAMNGAIFLMLGLVGMMLAAAGSFIFYLARRGRISPPVGPVSTSVQEGQQHA